MHLRVLGKKNTEPTNKKKKIFKFEALQAPFTCTLLHSFKMNTFAYQVLYPSPQVQTNLDWMELPWSGFYEEEEDDFFLALCGNGLCPGDCSTCVSAQQSINRIFLPIQGPVNKDGAPLGFLLLTE